MMRSTGVTIRWVGLGEGEGDWALLLLGRVHGRVAPGWPWQGSKCQFALSDSASSLNGATLPAIVQ
jgi:hypothetical protein